MAGIPVSTMRGTKLPGATVLLELRHAIHTATTTRMVSITPTAISAAIPAAIPAAISATIHATRAAISTTDAAARDAIRATVWIQHANTT